MTVLHIFKIQNHIKSLLQNVLTQQTNDISTPIPFPGSKLSNNKKMSKIGNPVPIKICYNLARHWLTQSKPFLLRHSVDQH